MSALAKVLSAFASRNLDLFLLGDRKFGKADRSLLNKSCFFKAKVHLQVRKKLPILNSFFRIVAYTDVQSSSFIN